MNAKITSNCHKKELAENLEKTPKAYENNAITSRIISYECYTQKKTKILEKHQKWKLKSFKILEKNSAIKSYTLNLAQKLATAFLCRQENGVSFQKNLEIS